MFLHMIDRLVVTASNLFRRLNYDRREASRMKRLRKLDVSIARKRVIPARCRKILLISTADGWGDSLFVAGLAKRLKQVGIISAVVVPSEFIAHYRNNSVFEKTFILGIDNNSAIGFSPDAAFDLSYTGMKNWQDRMMLLRNLQCACVTVSRMMSQLNVFSGFLEWGQKKHIGERMAMILSSLTHETECIVYPYARITPEDQEWATFFLDANFPVGTKTIAYVNRQAKDKDRCLSSEQVRSLVGELLRYGIDAVIVNDGTYSQKGINECVKKLPSVNFFQLSALIKKMSIVVTPDTAISHICSAFDIPSFIIFPPNDRDFWPKYSAADAWKGLSSKTMTYYVDDRDMHIDLFGYPSCRPGRNTDYTAKELSESLSCFLNRI